MDPKNVIVETGEKFPLFHHPILTFSKEIDYMIWLVRLSMDMMMFIQAILGMYIICFFLSIFYKSKGGIHK